MYGIVRLIAVIGVGDMEGWLRAGCRVKVKLSRYGPATRKRA